MADYFSSTSRFERRSIVHWLLPAWRRAGGSALHFRSAWSGSERRVLDFNQNAGTGIWGHHPQPALCALEALVEAGTPLRLPLARCNAEETLRAQLLALASPALGEDYECILVSACACPCRALPALRNSAVLMHTWHICTERIYMICCCC